MRNSFFRSATLLCSFGDECPANFTVCWSPYDATYEVTCVYQLVQINASFEPQPLPVEAREREKQIAST